MSESKSPSTKGRKRAEVTQNKFVFDMRRPVDPQSVLEYARAIADGGNPSPNTGIMTPSAYAKAVEEQNEARKAGKTVPSLPPIYQPARVGHAMRTKARFAMNGQPSKNTRKPKNWDGSGLGEWEAPAYIADPLVESARTPRRCHKHSIRDLVIDPENNIVQIGRFHYVIGADDKSAIFSITGSKTGNYGANIAAGKSMSFAESDGLGNIVGQINNTAYMDYFDDGTKPGAAIVWEAEQCIKSWGYLTRNDRKLSYAQMRKAVEDKDFDGIEFVEIEAPIVGASLTESKFWQSVKRSMSLVVTKDESEKNALERFEKRGMGRRQGKDVQKNSWTNIKVQCRTDPAEMFPFGFFNSQTGIVPCFHYGDNLEDERVRFVIGARVGAEWRENQHKARRRLGLVASTEKVAKPRKARVKTEPAAAEAPAKAARPKMSDADRKARKAANDKARRAKKKAANAASTAPATETANQTELVGAGS